MRRPSTPTFPLLATSRRCSGNATSDRARSRRRGQVRPRATHRGVDRTPRHRARPDLLVRWAPTDPSGPLGGRPTTVAAATTWVLDGDLGPNDALQPRLANADTVVILDFGVLRCAWRARRRSPEQRDFWWWLVTWRRRSKPQILAAIARWAPGADVHILRKPLDVDRFLAAFHNVAPVGRTGWRNIAPVDCLWTSRSPATPLR